MRILGVEYVLSQAFIGLMCEVLGTKLAEPGADGKLAWRFCEIQKIPAD